MKARCHEYNWACARLRKDPPQFQSPKANSWRLVPAPAVLYSDKAARAARNAQELLHRVIQDHPDTPWALLAQRELEYPFGFKWVENYIPPPQPSENRAELASRHKNSSKLGAKPHEPPKLLWSVRKTRAGCRKTAGKSAKSSHLSPWWSAKPVSLIELR